ncbi:MAG: YkgJ family cysteine cluster protein [Candidatus Thorarchaeota archaeon]
MVTVKELRFGCTRCGNCCTDKSTIVNTTYFDIIRIVSGLNLSIEDTFEVLGFYLLDQEMNDYELEKMVISPVNTEKGLAFMGLIKNHDGICFFYDSVKKKCSIYSLRPGFCKTFPFSFKEVESEGSKRKIEIFYTEKGKQYCLGINSDSPIIDKDYWEDLAITILSELKKNEIFISKWNESVKMGIVKPTVRSLIERIFKLII